MSNQGFVSGPLTYKAGVAIGANLLATLTSTVGTVGLCGASGFPVGVADGDIASGAYGAFKPLEGRVRVICSSAITAGDFVKAGANGKVAPEANTAVRTAATIGIAETGTTTDGDAFYMVAD